MQIYEHVRRRKKTDLHACFALELPGLINGLDGPIELLPKCLGEELLNRDVELLGEDYSETRIDVVLIVVSQVLCQMDVM
jgi:hypothetical protein